LGIIVSERIALHVGRNADNAHYLDTKARRMGHLIDHHPESDSTVAPFYR
jgi:GTP cyclohydrolase II